MFRTGIKQSSSNSIYDVQYFDIIEQNMIDTTIINILPSIQFQTCIVILYKIVMIQLFFLLIYYCHYMYNNHI